MFSNFWSKYVMGGDARPSGRVPKRVDAGNLEGKTLPCSGSLCFPQERYPHRGEARGNCCECHSPLSTVSVPSATCRRHRSTYGDATVSGECQAFGDDDDGGRSLNQLKCRSYSAAGVYPAPRAEGVELGQTPGGGRTLSGVRLPERETCSETSEKIASLAHGGMQDRSVLQPVRSCGSIKDTEKERIVRSASTTRLSNMSLVYFEDHLVNDADVVGSALGKPMTPQSYSSLMFSSDFEMLSIADEGIMRRLTSGATQSLSSHQLMAVASGVATPPPARTRYSNSGPNDHEQYVQIPGHPCSEVSRLCGCANSPCRGNTENTGTAQSMNAQHCTECACGPVAAASLSTGCLLPSVGKAVKNSVQCPSSQCALHPSALTRERMVVSVPPDPKDLLTVNAGSPRVDFLQRNVINCCVAVKRPLSSGKIIINGKYVVYSDHCLGVGSYSKVFLCYCLYEKMFYAMKIYNRGKLRRKGFGVNSPVNKVRREVDIMRKLKHQNIVSLVEVIDDPSSHKMYMVIEFAERGAIMSLENNGTVVSNAYGSGLGEEGVARIIRCVVGALIYAHENRVVHRDVKTQNILVNAEGCAKLSDFGVSMVLDGSTTTAYREGTVAFLPPEMLSSFEVRIEPGHLPSHKQCTADNGEGSFQQGSQLYDGATKVPAAEESMGDTACLETTRCNASSVPEASNSVGDVLGKDSAALSSAGRENIPQVDLFKVDVFALGVTTFVLLMGRLPWRAGSSRSQIKAIYAEPDPFERELQESSGSLHEDEQRDCVLCDECSLGCEDLTGHDGCSVRIWGSS
uniref:Protein kinase domain-containing protein n=1 Tax=Trypanosoma congolense (strain IL3000) TaxID=1068625 RepID=G0UYQ9_TRYCI|nr:putative protein kinase [Trypanosoma congolense IL3000]